MSALPAAEGEAMTVKVTLRPDVFPELHRELMALPERLRAQRLRALAAQGLAAELVPASRRSARAAPQRGDEERLPGGKAPTGRKVTARQAVGALPVASRPFVGKDDREEGRLSAGEASGRGFAEQGQALGALPVAGDPTNSNRVTAHGPSDVPATGRAQQPADDGVRGGAAPTADPGPTTQAQAPSESNRTGAFNLAVMMAKRGVFAG